MILYVHVGVLILSVFVGERLSRSGKLAKLVTDHLIGHLELDVLLSVVDLELQANKLRQYRARSGVGSDGSARFQSVGNR